MFLILKKTVKIVNSQTKSYFVNKLQNYDNLDLNISEKYFNSFSNKVLLFKTDFLNDITKMNIDK